MTRDDALDRLKAYSALVGDDRQLVQGAGGNTSVKIGHAMWIKASGTRLRDALDEDIFVSVDWQAIARAVDDDPELADQPYKFAAAGELRPSIETCLHAVIGYRVVLHCHCVNTIAIAIRADAEAIARDRLLGLNWAMVPYRKPGAELAIAVKAAARPETKVFILRNHGLIVAAETIGEAQSLLEDVVTRLRADPVSGAKFAEADLRPYETEGYRAAPADHGLHAIALNDARLAAATAGGLFPDQVLFGGPCLGHVAAGGNVEDCLAAIRSRELPDPVAILVSGRGALLSRLASPTDLEMALCAGDVLQRVPEGAQLTYIQREDCLAILNWDAEKYRQALVY